MSKVDGQEHQFTQQLTISATATATATVELYIQTWQVYRNIVVIVIPHRIRTPFSENLHYLHRESRPWDNDIARLKPPAPPPHQVSVSDRLRPFEITDPTTAVVTPSVRVSNPLNAFLSITPQQQQSVYNDNNSRSSATFSYPSQSTASLQQQPVSAANGLHTIIGNRPVKPLLTAPNPPPLVGLPVPSAQNQNQNRPLSTSSKPIPEPLRYPTTTRRLAVRHHHH